MFHIKSVVNKTKKSAIAVIAIAIASLLWGTTGTVASLAPNVSPLAIGAFSTGMGGLLLFIHGRKNVVSEHAKLAKTPKLLLIGSIAIAIYPLAFYISMEYSGVAIGTVISIATAPLFSAMLERFINRKLISLQWVISFIFGALGVILITLGKHTATDLDVNQSSQYLNWGSQYLGIIFGCAAGLGYAIYAWAAKQMIARDISSTSSVASMFGLASILLLPSLFFTADNLFTQHSNILVGLYLAIIPMFCGYLLFGYGLRHLEVSSATLITLLEPAIATLLAVIVIGEVFDLIGWVGMIFIAACLVLQMQILPSKHKAK